MTPPPPPQKKKENSAEYRALFPTAPPETRQINEFQIESSVDFYFKWSYLSFLFDCLGDRSLCIVATVHVCYVIQYKK